MPENITSIPESLKDASKEQLKDLLVGFQALIKSNPKLRSKISKEDGSHGGYYNKSEAEALKPFLDEMIIDNQDREFKFNDYPYWSPNTVWVKVNQAIKYIVENDTTLDKKYCIFRNKLKICKTETGILFKIIDTPSYSGWIAHKVDKDTESVLEDYKTKVFYFT